MAIKPEVSAARVARARSAVGKGVLYKLGHGGTDPKAPLPSKTKYCDCSGFIAWVIGLNRAPKPSRPWWIETTNICVDAKSGKPSSIFVKLSAPEPGCLVAYPDRIVAGKVRQGHVALVSAFQGNRFMCIDCGAGNGGKTVEAIRERDLTDLFNSKGAIFVALRQDL